MMFNSRHFLFTALSCGLISVPAVGLFGQQSAAPASTQQAQPAAGQGQGQGQEADPMRRQLSDKERYRAQKELRRELKGPYKTWLNEEVPYIISDDERKAFMSLANDEERESFIETFWQRRNPNPDSPENEAREEHYRRIAFANTHFAVKQPGWTTDRGRIYIVDGKPDSIDSHTSGAQGDTTPFEVWHYHRPQQPWQSGGIVDVKFVDECRCGDYKLVPSPNL